MNILRSTRDLRTGSFAELAKLVRAIKREVERRNPIFVNAYTPYLEQAALALEEIHAGELRNPSCEAGPKVRSHS